MILGPVSLIDCLVFVTFLIPQLLLRVGIFRSLEVGASALPFLVKLPYQLVKGRYRTPTVDQHRFIKESTLFEDLVVRCVRWAFKYVAPDVGKVFFSKHVALPFVRWRMLRHGYLHCPTYWREYEYGQGSESFRGLWVRHDPEQAPDFVLYYVHGGGFAMGSAYFYLEFLMVWHQLLVEAGYKNPAVFTIDYTLVPQGVYPRQISETLEGYKHVLDTVKDNDASRVCVAGDSAGGALILSLLQELGAKASTQKRRGVKAEVQGSLAAPGSPDLPLPRLATLISPWVTLITNSHYPSTIDYLDRQTLWRFAHEYAGETMVNQHPASPGNCLDDGLWKAARPERGYYVIYGEEEVFGPDIEGFVKRQTQLGIETTSYKIPGGIHAWPVASLFLCSTAEKRLDGLRRLVREIKVRAGDEAGVKN